MISDGKAAPAVALAAGISEPAALFSPKSTGYLPAAGKKLFRRFESFGNKARVNPLLDSMRASSPSRRASDTAATTSWTLHHPSALTMFDEIAAVLSGKHVAIFLDYDGTLSPIVEDPDSATMSPEMKEAVKDVAKNFPTAIVSGRCRAKVYDFVQLPELYYAGSHGMDIKGPSKGHRKGNQTVLCQPAKEFLPIIEEVHKILVEKMKCIPGAKVENNKFCLSVHYRCVEEKRWDEVGEQVKSVIKDFQQLRMDQGRKVLEIRPTIKWDKGNALEFLLNALGYAGSNDVVPIYIGDDRTDEDAFRVLKDRGQGFGVLVSKYPKETNASYTLKEPSEVMQFLNCLVAWKKRRSFGRDLDN